MMLRDLVVANRSCRRFHEDHPVGYDVLTELVDLARHAASAGNRQPLKYLLACEPARNELIFRNLGWAGYLKDWPGPPPGERPSATAARTGTVVKWAPSARRAACRAAGSSP